jgi:hypothetical protein
MRDALTVPIATAALVLCLAGVAKVRAPATAVAALEEAGLTGPVRWGWAAAPLIRVFAALELMVGCAALTAGGAAAAVMAGAYAGFAGLALVLARRASVCGCFGEHEAPATAWHSALSAALAALCGAAALIGEPRSLAWQALHRPPAAAGLLVLAACACAYATLLAYTELPASWRAWRAG